MATMDRLYEHEQAVAIRAVREAARLCRAVQAEISPEVLAKQDKSPVTVADFGSQALICRELAEAFPNDPVIAEENADELRRPENAPLLGKVGMHVRAVRSVSTEISAIDFGGEQICRWIDHGSSDRYQERFWTLDPIDGTKGFLRGDQYAVALALIVGGQVTVAALACPNLTDKTDRAPRDDKERGPDGLICCAARGQGAFVVPAEYAGPAEPAWARISASRNDDPARARFCESVESGHSAQGDAAVVAARLGITTAPLRMDSQAKYAVVARGEADIYLRMPTRSDYREKIWDHAAGSLIVTEAGGTVTDIKGRPLEFNRGRELTANQGVIVTNGRLHERVVAAVSEIGHV
jgi:3'(2'), 5'-bisphosphate nucleotidase